MNDRELLQMALDALVETQQENDLARRLRPRISAAIAALRERLDAQQEEPVYTSPERVQKTVESEHVAQQAEPVAWRARGYAQFKTGKPGPWRYFDGPTRPKVNDPECCDIEPLYTAPQQPLTAAERTALTNLADALGRALGEP